MLAHDEQYGTRLRFYRHCDLPEDSVDELLAGLQQTPKRIHPKYFYDEPGSLLFDKITELPEYYPTRAEKNILRRYGPVIATYVGRDCVLIEPGSGTSEKVELLLDILRPSAYVALDISAEHVRAAARRLTEHFPWLRCHAVAADYSRAIELPAGLEPGRRVVFYPGSSIGNFEPAAAIRFLASLRDSVGAGGGLLIGVDLQKDDAILRNAYNDRRGVTAAFNRNILRHVNRLTGATFCVEGFDHVAFYNSVHQRIEMHLQSRYDHSVKVGGETIRVASGERIHTENSYKYTTESFSALAALAGFRREQTWYDNNHLFSLHYLVADPRPALLVPDPDSEHLHTPHFGARPSPRPNPAN